MNTCRCHRGVVCCWCGLLSLVRFCVYVLLADAGLLHAVMYQIVLPYDPLCDRSPTATATGEAVKTRMYGRSQSSTAS
jgi:hypothetical protein